MKVYKNEEQQRLAGEEKRAEGKKRQLKRGLQKKERPPEEKAHKQRVDKLSTASEL